MVLHTKPTVDSCCHAGTLWRLQTAGSIDGRAKDWGHSLFINAANKSSMCGRQRAIDDCHAGHMTNSVAGRWALVLEGSQWAAGSTLACIMSLRGNNAGVRQTCVRLETRRVNSHSLGDQHWQGGRSLSGCLATTWLGRAPAGRVARAHEKCPIYVEKACAMSQETNLAFGSQVRRSVVST